MVAYVYETEYLREGKYPKEIMCLPASGGRCEVLEYWDGNGKTYECEVTIGNRDKYIRLRGTVVHNLVKSVMRGTCNRTKKAMIQHLSQLLQEEEDEKHELR